ncbi:MAG: oligosaccharide flippase family protein [Clostridium saudiense]|nr:oligosaccharide flippase family protein [Clostridium saudiense]
MNRIDLSEKQVKKNMILGTVYKGLSMIVSYLYVPLVLFYLGEVRYGIWTTILNVLSWITYFDVGIGNGLRNKLAESLAQKEEGQEKKICRYVSSAYVMMAIIVLGAILIGCILSGIINWESIFGVKKYDENLKIIMGISILFVGINFWLSLCKSIYYAIQENSKVGLMGVLQQVLMLVGVFVLIKCGKPSILLVAILYGITDFIVSIAFSFSLFRKDKAFIPKLSQYSAQEAKETTTLGIKFFVVQIAALILFTTDNLIISHFIGPAEVTSYSIVNKLFSIGTALFTMLVTPYWSRTAAAKAEENYTMIKNSIYAMYKLMALGIIGVAVLVAIFRPLAHLWLQKNLNYSPGLIPLMGVYAIIFMWNAIYSQIANGLSLLKVLMPVAIAQGIINIPLSLLFLLKFNMGVVGVLLGTVCATLISAIITPYYTWKEIRNHINEGER